MMNRRQALSRVSLILGGTIIGAEAFLTSCETGPLQLSNVEFTANNLTFLNEVGDTIIPTTPDSPGAKAAQIGEFMKTIVNDCYEPKDQTIFLNGIQALNDAAKAKYQKEFLDLTDAEKKEFLIEIDAAAKEHEEALEPEGDSHYFTMMKQLTLWGYFTSEIGATQALRYVEVPGRYDGNYPYQKGDKAWAL